MGKEAGPPHLRSVWLFSIDAPLKIIQALEMYSFPSTGFMSDKAQTFCVEIQIFREIAWIVGGYEWLVPMLRRQECSLWGRAHFTLNEPCLQIQIFVAYFIRGEGESLTASSGLCTFILISGTVPQVHGAACLCQ